MGQDLPTACERCRSRRKKCGRELDGCAQCKEKGKICIYHTDKRKRTKTNSHSNQVDEIVTSSSTHTANDRNAPLSFQLNPYAPPMSITDSSHSTMASGREVDPMPFAASSTSSNLLDASIDSNFDSTALLDPSLWDNNQMLFSWLDFDLMDTGGATSIPTPASSHRLQLDGDLWASGTPSNESVVLAALPSRSQCDYLMQVLEVRTKASPFTSPGNFVDMNSMKETIKSLLDQRESHTLSPSTPASGMTDKPFFSSDTFRAVAGLACAFIRRSYTPFNKVAQESLRATRSTNSNIESEEAAQERQEITQLIRACQICLNTIKGSTSSIDLARLQAYRMFAMVLAWWGDLKEASHVSWLGIRYATSVGLHRKEGLQAALSNGTFEYVYLDVFWQIFNQAPMFQILTNREMPVDVESITVPLPHFPKDSGTRERLLVQFVGAQIADKYFRDASGLRLPSEKTTSVLESLQPLSMEDEVIYQRLNTDLDRCEQGLGDLFKNNSHKPIHTLQGSVQPMLVFYRYIRLLVNYPFSLQINQAAFQVRESIRSIFVSTWSLSKTFTSSSSSSINRPSILAGVCLRTMIFAAEILERSNPYEADQWKSYLTLGYDALERLCSHTESSKTLNLAKEILIEVERER